MTEGIVGNPRYINPLLAQASDADRDLTELVYAGLLRYDESGALIPDLAESYSISADGLSYTFKLRENITWHDDEPFTADDVVFTINTAQNADYDSPQRINWQGVEVTKLDDSTVIFKLRNRYGQFLNNMTLGILPRHLWAQVKPANFSLSELNTKPIGSGPYQFVSFKKNKLGQIDSYRLERFKDYHDQPPYISTIVLSFYNSEDSLIQAYNHGDVDSLSFISPQKLTSLRFQSKLTLNRISLPRYFAVFFNENKNKILADRNIRIGLNQATNKDEIIKKVLNGGGIRVDSPLMSGILNVPASSKRYDFSPDAARASIAKAGWQYSESEKGYILPGKSTGKGKDAKTSEPQRLAIELTTSDWPELLSVAGEIKNQWEAVGVRVNIRVLAVSELQQAIRERNYEMLLFGEVLNIDPDPFSFWHSSQKRDPGLNLALFDNKNADKLLEDARQEIDTDLRRKKYADFQDIVISEAPAVFLYSSDYIYPQARSIKNNTTKIIGSPSGRFDAIGSWYIDTDRVFGR